MLELRPMTRELFHELYKGFEYDPVMFMDMELYDRVKDLPYSFDRTEAKYEKYLCNDSYLSFAVMLDGAMIGEVVLKHIDRKKKQCELGIHLINDSVKGKGYGTEAEKLAIEFAFRELNMERIFADSIIKNERSQHILLKLGFRFLKEENGFRYYVLEKENKCC